MHFNVYILFTYLVIKNNSCDACDCFPEMKLQRFTTKRLANIVRQP